MKLKQVLGSTSNPAFAVDQDGRIVGLNRQAELALGHLEAEVLGKPCHDVMCAKDIFGNVYCRQDCSLLAMARDHEPISGFRFQVKTAEGEYVPADAAVVTLPDPEGEGFSLVHILQPRPQHNGNGCRPSAEPTDAQARDVGSAGAGSFGLTPRELQVLRMLTLGKNCRQIAESFSIGLVTVRNHVYNIRQKLDVRSQAEAVAFALRNGVV